MSSTRARLRTLAATVAAVGATAAFTLSAPLAHATTTTSCPNGLWIYPSNFIGAFSCSGFADHGAPYVFHIASVVAQNYPLPGDRGGIANLVATCGGYTTPNPTTIDGTGCTYTF